MESVSGWLALAVITYKIFFGFLIMSVIRGIFMQEVFKEASTNDYLMVLQKERQNVHHKKKMQALFEAADASGDGFVGWDEFQTIMEDPDVKTWLAAQDLVVSDARWLFDTIAGDDT